jgi:hypothetical protein
MRNIVWKILFIAFLAPFLLLGFVCGAILSGCLGGLKMFKMFFDGI